MFNELENIHVALDALGANKGRAFLTMLGVTIGVSAVILMVSMGQAVEAFIMEQFSTIGSNMVMVFGVMEDSMGKTRLLTQKDADALADIYRVPDAEVVVPGLEVGGQFGTTVSYEGVELTASVYGTTASFLRAYNRTVVDGRMFTESELISGARVAVIGQTLVDKLFGDTYPIGREIRVHGVRLQVIGILNEVGIAGFGPQSDQDNWVVLPLSTAQARMSGERTVGGERPVTWVVLLARDKSVVDAVVEQVRQTMREEHRISFRDEDDFEIATVDDILAVVSSITGILTVFLGAIAGISLLVGGIGIMNIMLVTVTERTHEIGLRKAVGAQRRDIVIQFLTESILLALIGGGIGVLLAAGATSLATTAMPDLSVRVQLSSVALAAIICVVIGTFFGIYPANRAATLNPIDALRYE